MAPTQGSRTKGGKMSKTSTKFSAVGKTSKSQISKTIKAPPPKQQKTKPSNIPAKKKKRVYSEKELGVPKLNMITPVGVNKPKGKKKGKIFVDDQESMMTILALANANKEGQIESKMMKSRQMEEIREARRKEAEVRQEQRNSKLEETKNSMRKKRKRKSETTVEAEASDSVSKISKDANSSRKRVSFA